TARAAVATARAAPPADPPAVAVVTALSGEIEHVCGLAERVIAQTQRRVFDGDQVPVHEKLFSIFEPHTDLIKRGKAHRPVEFGHKVFLAESRHGLITDYRMLDGNPSDEDHVAPSLTQHEATFGRAPALYATDRGFYPPANVAAATARGVARGCRPPQL